MNFFKLRYALDMHLNFFMRKKNATVRLNSYSFSLLSIKQICGWAPSNRVLMYKSIILFILITHARLCFHMMAVTYTDVGLHLDCVPQISRQLCLSFTLLGWISLLVFDVTEFYHSTRAIWSDMYGIFNSKFCHQL